LHQLKRFFAYEAFTAHNEILVQDADSMEKAIPTWNAYSRGVEALAIPLASINNRDASRKKALTLRDLLIKVSALAYKQLAGTSRILTGH